MIYDFVLFAIQIIGDILIITLRFNVEYFFQQHCYFIVCHVWKGDSSDSFKSFLIEGEDTFIQ